MWHMPCLVLVLPPGVLLKVPSLFISPSDCRLGVTGGGDGARLIWPPSSEPHTHLLHATCAHGPIAAPGPSSGPATPPALQPSPSPQPHVLASIGVWSVMSA